MTYEEIRGRLSRKRVGIAGCGGLGSNCAIALARVGMGTLVIVDFDRLSLSNLNRQYYFRDQVGMKKVEALADNILR
ncbi:MAG TPA: ThiF family adenylyltransferase, partial [Bacteroidales bacterium]|nr:ThiF family adenylyltransferase [Bacteroidales bacterium]